MTTYCEDHGAADDGHGYCATQAVLDQLSQHRAYQFARYGSNHDTANGTGPTVQWLPMCPFDAQEIEQLLRDDWDYDVDPSREKMTWMRLVREEVAEAFAAEDETVLYQELLDVAALCVSWMEKLREKGVRP